MDKINTNSEKNNSLLLHALLLILSLFLIYFTLAKGLPNEFSYNIPWLKEIMGQAFANEEILKFSRLFYNPVLHLGSLLFHSYGLIFSFFTFCNFIVFSIGSLLLLGASYRSVLFSFMFFICNEKLLLSGTSSSFCYSLLLVGFALDFKRRNIAFYIFVLSSLWIYPIATLMLLFYRWVCQVRDRQWLDAGITSAITVLLLLFKKFVLGLDGLEGEFFSSYQSLQQIFQDPYFFGESMVNMAQRPNWISLLQSILTDNTKIGTTLFSLSPLGSMRFLSLTLIFLALILERDSMIESFKHCRLALFAALGLYTLALIAAFKLYYPSRYIMGPVFLIVNYLVMEAVWNLKKFRVTVPACAIVTLVFYSSFSSFYPALITRDSYLGYLSLSTRELDLPRLEDYFNSDELQNSVYMASPRLSAWLMLVTNRHAPYLSYKFVDKNYELRRRSSQLWKTYTAGTLLELKTQCRQAGADFFILETELLQAIKNGDWQRIGRNLVVPHRQDLDTKQLPIIDYEVSEGIKLGSLEILKC